MLKRSSQARKITKTFFSFTVTGDKPRSLCQETNSLPRATNDGFIVIKSYSIDMHKRCILEDIDDFTPIFLLFLYSSTSRSSHFPSSPCPAPAARVEARSWGLHVSTPPGSRFRHSRSQSPPACPSGSAREGCDEVPCKLSVRCWNSDPPVRGSSVDLPVACVGRMVCSLLGLYVTKALVNACETW